MEQKPSSGRILHYQLDAEDVQLIRDQRPVGERVGNPVEVGDVVPLIVVKVWPNEFGEGVPGANGQAFLDGFDGLWVTSAREGTEPGTWAWPPRV